MYYKELIERYLASAKEKWIAVKVDRKVGLTAVFSGSSETLPLLLLFFNYGAVVLVPPCSETRWVWNKMDPSSVGERYGKHLYVPANLPSINSCQVSSSAQSLTPVMVSWAIVYPGALWQPHEGTLLRGKWGVPVMCHSQLRIRC